MYKDILEIIEREIKFMFHSESSGHDIYHLKRVSNLALHIQGKEGGDRLVITYSSMLHDIHRIIQTETKKYCSPANSLPKVREILERVSASADKIPKILHCVEFHEEYGFSEKAKTVSDIETLILQDADNLDAMGAIGIARTFAFGGAYGIPIWIPELSFDKKYFDESKNDLSEIHHFHSKLLRLKDNMNTETARKIAEGRHKFMEEFLERFFKEWKGEI